MSCSEYGGRGISPLSPSVSIPYQSLRVHISMCSVKCLRYRVSKGCMVTSAHILMIESLLCSELEITTGHRTFRPK